jgi:hypothetical protein
VAKSDAYGRSATPRPGAERDDRYQSHARLRPIPGPILLDAIAQVTGARLTFPDAPEAARAQQVDDEDGGSYSLRVLGRCPRDGSIDPATPPSPTISMALHLIHGPPASSWLAGPGSMIETIAKNPPPPPRLAEELFLASLGRVPTAEERSRAAEALGRSFVQEKAEDLLWALLASTEFATNH